MSDVDLSLVSADDLRDELLKRFDAMVIYGVNRRTENIELRFRRWTGSPFTCIGLARAAIYDLLDALDRSDAEAEEDA
jgi:hypothetical protein